MFKRLKQEHPLFLPFFYKLVNMQLSVGFYLISKIVMIISKITFKKEHVKGGVYTWLYCMHDLILTGLRSSAEKEEPKKSITITVQILKLSIIEMKRRMFLHRQTDSLYFRTMILKPMQLIGWCIKTKPKNQIYT